MDPLPPFAGDWRHLYVGFEGPVVPSEVRYTISHGGSSELLIAQSRCMVWRHGQVKPEDVIDLTVRRPRISETRVRCGRCVVVARSIDVESRTAWDYSGLKIAPST